MNDELDRELDRAYIKIIAERLRQNPIAQDIALVFFRLGLIIGSVVAWLAAGLLWWATR